MRIPRRRAGATGVVLLGLVLLAPLVWLGRDDPAPRPVGGQADVRSVERELEELPGVESALVTRFDEQDEDVTLIVDVAADDDVEREDVAAMVEKIEKLALLRGTITFDDRDAADPDLPTSLGLGYADGVAAETRVARLFAARERFDHGVTVAADSLTVDLAGESVATLTRTWRVVAADPVLREVRHVRVGTEAGTGAPSTFDLASDTGADGRALAVWTDALALLDGAPAEIRATGLRVSVSGEGDPASEVRVTVRDGSRPAESAPHVQDPAVRRVVLDLLDLLGRLEPGSSAAIGTSDDEEFLQVSYDDSGGGLTAYGAGGWPAFARRQVRG